LVSLQNEQMSEQNTIKQVHKQASKQAAKSGSKYRSHDLQLARQQKHYRHKASPFCGQKVRFVKTSVGILEAPADESDAEGAELRGSASSK
jgi:hypothetical protein